METAAIYGSAFSTDTQRVWAAAYETDFNFQMEKIDLQRLEQKKDPFTSINPFGEVPALKIGDVKLHGARAITQYIAEAKPELLGMPDEREEMLKWMEVEANQFEPLAFQLCWEQIYKVMLGMTTDAGAVAALEAKLGKVLDAYEKRLSESTFLAGTKFTLADLHHLPALQMLMDCDSNKVIATRRYVLTWAKSILGRVAWKKVLEKKKY